MKAQRNLIYRAILDECIAAVTEKMCRGEYGFCERVITHIHNIPKIMGNDEVRDEMHFVSCECDIIDVYEPELAAKLLPHWRALVEDLRNDPVALAHEKERLSRKFGTTLRWDGGRAFLTGGTK